MTTEREKARREVQRLGGKATDLGRLKALGDPERIAAELREAELAAGERCGGCHRRIRVGIRFRKRAVEMGEKGLVVITEYASACTRNDCGYAEEVRAAEPQVMEPVEFAWLDGLPDDDGYRAPEPDPDSNGKAA